MSIKVVLDKKAQIFIRGLSRRVRTDVPKQGQKMGVILRDSIEKEIDNFAENPSGALARSFDVRVSSTGKGSISVTMASDLPYALIHETGGTIKAKNPTGFLTFFSRGSWHKKRSVFIKRKSYLTKALKRALPKLQKLTLRTLATIVRTSARR